MLYVLFSSISISSHSLFHLDHVTIQKENRTDTISMFSLSYSLRNICKWSLSTNTSLAWNTGSIINIITIK